MYGLPNSATSAREVVCECRERDAERNMEHPHMHISTKEMQGAELAREPMDERSDPLRHAGMLTPEQLTANGRRAFLGAAALLTLAACAPKQDASLVKAPTRPDGIWDSGPAPLTPPPSVPRSPNTPQAKAAPIAAPVSNGPAALAWAKPRSLWAQGAPVVPLMNPMLPVTSITVHHDGLDKLITSTNTGEMADRIDLYRTGHQAKGWGDIGYHLIIDRAGTLWQGRSIKYQGAHVKNRNEGNIGVLVMGNFEIQSPTKAQLATLSRVLTDLRGQYRVSKSHVYSHREWKGAATSCPGDKLQVAFAKIRTAQRA